MNCGHEVHPKVIVFGNGLGNTLGLIRSVGECGIPVTLILEPGGKTDNPVRFSRYVERIHDLTTLDEVVVVLKREYWDCPQRPIVLCGSDPSISVLDRRYDELKDRFVVFNARQTGRICHFLDKANTFPLAERAGLSLARTWRQTGGSPIPEGVVYPCLIKGNNSTTSTKDDMLVCQNERELRNSLRPGVDYLIQEYLEKEHELDVVGFSADHGERVIVPAVVRKLRDDLHRQSVYVRLDDIRDYPDLDPEAIRRLVREIGYEGIFSVELIYCKGRYHFLEINLRNDGCAWLYTAAGINYPKLWIDYGRGALSDDELKRVVFRKPYCAIDLYDIYNVIEGKVSVWRWFRECLFADDRFGICLRDPIPFLVSMAIHFRQLCKKIVRRVWRRG